MRPEGDELARLETLIGYALRRAQAAVSRCFLASFADLDVRQTQLGILSVVEARPGIKPSRAGALLGIKRANIGPLVEGLERRGIVRRQASADDRRSHELYLTQEGRALLDDLRQREAAHEARIASALDDGEREQLLRLLSKVAAAAMADDPDEEDSP